MLADLALTAPLDEELSAWPATLAEELEFYGSYEWSLNPHLTVAEAAEHLRDELAKLPTMQDGWQVAAVATNVFLLSCGLFNCVDDYLRGPALQLPRFPSAGRLGRAGARLVETLSRNPYSRRGARLRDWRTRFLAALDVFLLPLAQGCNRDAAVLVRAGRCLLEVLDEGAVLLPGRRLLVPSLFSRLDLAEADVLALGRAMLAALPDRSKPLLLVGLRTSGSYIAPLLRACLEAGGCASVSLLTIDPKKGAGREEAHELRRFADFGHRAVIVDDPPHSAGTILAALEIVRRCGFDRDRIKIVVPTHPASRSWAKSIPPQLVVTIAPEHWHKRMLLERAAVEHRLTEYFCRRSSSNAVVKVSVIGEGTPAEYDPRIAQIPFDDRSSRLQRVFEIELKTTDGRKGTRYVLAKSVGWGWFSYASFLAGERLAGFVPPILGLRDGILYMEFLPSRAGAQNKNGGDASAREQRQKLLATAASYVATRVGRLGLVPPPQEGGMDLGRQNNGIRILEKALSRAHGPILTDTLMRARLRRSLRQLPCPFPTLIDGNMLCSEWVGSPTGPLKCDYEHHGMGKAALNVADPAYDVADSILHLALEGDEETEFLRRYAEHSGDAEVRQRLFMYKLLAGLWAMKEVQEQMPSARGVAVQQELHGRFMRAWDFLTVQAARHCGAHCVQPAAVDWRAPVVALDIDGVIDRRVFGFPCTTAAGIEALSLLHAHEMSVVVNTARSVAEVKTYCEAYALAGGIAEHGSFIWDAVHGRGRSLIHAETVRQLEELRRRLRAIPGVFLDDRHQYSVRAFIYRDQPDGFLASLAQSMRASDIGDGALAPLPTVMVQSVMSECGLDRLSFHHTTIDTTFVAEETDKGTGLLALRDWVLGGDAETIAVGDHAQDLPMFRVATRGFAPANVNCRAAARLLGVRIASRPFQSGLFEIARAIVHSDAATCTRSIEAQAAQQRGGADDLFTRTLRAADRSFAANLAQALFDRSAFKIFIR